MKEISKFINKIHLGNCIDVLTQIPDNSIDSIYLDPPFFTQKTHSLVDSKSKTEYSFNDKYKSLEEYLELIKSSLSECKRVLKGKGTIFLHCDKTASHHLRTILDEVFGVNNFLNEIVWSYKRWSNSRKGLLNSHQTILLYKKSKDWKFNTIYTDYSETTNVDQILQERERNLFGKSVYKKDEQGNVVKANEKKGVPLSDVWEIPFLNPKAKERTGYPTQKPVELLKRIIEISTDENDIILDPFCGSGTTCVAAKLLKRNFIGIDISNDAVSLTKLRLNEMVITESQLLKKGKQSYVGKSDEELNLLNSINALPVHRNSLIDGYMKETLIPIIIQKKTDTVYSIKEKIVELCKKQSPDTIIIIQTTPSFQIDTTRCKLHIIKTLACQL